MKYGSFPVWCLPAVILISSCGPDVEPPDISVSSSEPEVSTSDNTRGASQNSKKMDLSKIHGKIQLVNSFPDYKVQVVDSFADLHVKKVTSFPDDPGEWQIVDSFPDFKIQIVTSFPDFKIKYVDSFPGVQ